jgi:alpha-L-fucosidase
MNKRTSFLAIFTAAGIVVGGLSCAGGGSNGTTGSGGTSATGGFTGSGGTGTGDGAGGGQAETGGQSGSGAGGAVSTGGAGAGAAAGSTGSGGGTGAVGSGGRGGSTATGGTTGGGGASGTGGSGTGKAGATGTGGAGTGGAGSGGAGSGGTGTGGTGGAGGGTCTGAICTAKSWSDITAAHAVPAWVKSAKLGIGMHFMVATVPAYHNEWFFQHEYCNSAFATWTSQNFPTKSPLSGGPWGYKDFIAQFTCAQWNMPAQPHQATTAATWAALFKASGATFVNATAQHHDRFAMWDSAEPASVGSAGTWNAAKMGPMRDVVGELGAAVKAQGMKFGVNNHILYGYSFAYCGAGGTTPGNVGPNTPATVSDLYDPKYADFYGPPNPGCGTEAGDAQCNPSKAFCDDWLYRTQELVDKYQLDDEWFDWDGATVAGSPCMDDKLAFALHYYQTAAARGQQVQIMSKAGIFGANVQNNGATGANVSLQDFQSSIPTGSAVPSSPWMVDETISSNGSWCYVNPMTYKSAATVISELDQINAAGGIMLLNISPEKDGTIPQEQIDILNAVGKHLGAPGNF